MKAEYIYKYDRESDDLFGVMEEMIGYDYDLASIKDLDQKWGDIVIVEEGQFKWDKKKKAYMKLEDNAS